MQHVVVAALLGMGLAAVLVPGSSAANSSTIDWQPCGRVLQNKYGTTSSVQCGNLSVPLDYNNTAAGPLTLNLMKVLAAKQPSKGSIMYNPGGPRISGRVDLAGQDGTVLSEYGRFSLS
ncbi:hypothetical protein ANO11243_034450 [Dothideomycetidae sp. 11243]|nr:hypothetical protein ANO11243_034450 [fungal sp. No.11243]